MPYKETIIKGSSANRNKLVILTGVSASGKDYLLDHTFKDNSHLYSRIKHIEFSRVLYEILSKKYKLESTDDLGGMLTQAQVYMGVRLSVDYILESLPGVLNTHVVYRQKSKLYFNTEPLKRLNPLSYVYVWTDPEVIYDRRKKGNRQRLIEDPDTIAYHQDYAINIVSSFAIREGISFQTICNNEDEIDKSKAKLAKLLQETIT